MNCNDFSLLRDQLIDHHSNFVRTAILAPAGFDLDIIEGFLECFIELLEAIFSDSCNNDKETSLAILVATLNDEVTYSNSIIAYLRLVASGWIKLNSDAVLPCNVDPDYLLRFT